MNVLLSAYACEPGKGSEPEVGWRWVLEMSKLHKITVLTRSNNQPIIETYLNEHPELCRGVEFIYFDLPAWTIKVKKRFNLLNWYYVLWQFRARKKIDRLIKEKAIDLVHLVTFASFRYPVFLSRLHIPVIWGPVGGGEIAPWGLLWYRLRFPACLKEVIRNISTSLSSLAVRWVNPTRTSGGCAIASTPRTQAILRKKGINSRLMPTIGMDVECEREADPAIASEKGLKFIFVGRLVLLKGVHLLLEGFAEAALRDASLTIVGSGAERKYLEMLASKLGVSAQVSFRGHVDKQELPHLYASHHVLIAPSLYESGGYMVLEAFQQRRPAIVLDVGGLAMSVDDSCGIKVCQGSGLDVVRGLADAMTYYAKHPEYIEVHGQAGFEKLCRIYNWEQKRSRMGRFYQEAVNCANIREPN